MYLIILFIILLLKSNVTNYFQMENIDSRSNHPCLIHFPDHVFGKANKNRKDDPSMFELLAWKVEGFDKHSFKKDEKFQQTTQAYLNMIGKDQWKTESQENFVDFNGHCLQVNSEVFRRIDNYIQERVPQQQKLRKKSADKYNNKEEKAKIQNQQELTQKSQKNYTCQGHEEKHEQQKQIKTKKNRKNSTNKFNQKRTVQQHKNKHITQRYYGKTYQKQKQQEQTITDSHQNKIIEHFKQTTRWIPNSAFTTYFGKPPFENYGRANTKPTDGGLIYGSYLYSHNVHPHRGSNHPQHLQSYPVALMKAKSQGTLVPTHPRTRLDHSKQLQRSEEKTQCSNKIEPEANCFNGSLDIEVPHLREMQKFGGKNKHRKSTDIRL